MIKIAVTGANGYIGRHVIEYLRSKNGIEVIAVDLKNDGLPPCVNFCPINILAHNDNIYELIGCPDILIHLAWRNGFIHDSPSHISDLSAHYDFIRTTLLGGLKNISIIGSMHEVGYFEGKIDENTPCNPQSQYGIAKNALRQSISEMIAREFGDVSFKWLRGFYVYGDDEKSNSVFSKIIKAVDEGKTEFPLNSGKNKYDYLSIDELAMQISEASIQTNINGIINCCSGEAVCLSKRIESFIAANNLPITPIYGKFPDRIYDSPIIYGDNNKIIKILKSTEE